MNEWQWRRPRMHRLFLILVYRSHLILSSAALSHATAGTQPDASVVVATLSHCRPEIAYIVCATVFVCWCVLWVWFSRFRWRCKKRFKSFAASLSAQKKWKRFLVWLSIPKWYSPFHWGHLGFLLRDKFHRRILIPFSFSTAALHLERESWIVLVYSIRSLWIVEAQLDRPQLIAVSHSASADVQMDSHF